MLHDHCGKFDRSGVKLLGRTGSQKSQRGSNGSVASSVQFFWSASRLGGNNKAIWKYGMELRISLKAVEGDTSKSRQ